MNTHRFLVPALLASSLSCLAQVPAEKAPVAAAPLPQGGENTPGKASGSGAQLIPRGRKLGEVQFNNVALSVVIGYLQQQEAEGENGSSLNVIVSPGLESLAVPSLNLRNVTTTEVLSIATSLLGLELKPVKGDDPQNIVAWVVKSPEAPRENRHDLNPAASVTYGNSAVTLDSVLGSSNQSIPGPALLQFNAPAAELASNLSSWVSNGSGTVVLKSPERTSKVYGISTLLPPQGDSPDQRAQRDTLRDKLLDQIVKFAKDQDEAAEVRSYPDLDLMVVKSTALPLITEAIEAMKLDAAALSSASGALGSGGRSEPPTKAGDEKPAPRARAL
jgi:hypothetical protein